jgi:methionyl-tRNA formyltransferase
MRIVFAGSSGIGIPSLESLVDLQLNGAEIEVAGLITNPDSPRGRKGNPEPTEISAAALELSEKLKIRGFPPIRQFKPEKLLSEARELLRPLAGDVLISFAYGRIFGPQFLALFPLGGINIHPSLLPKYRGAAPIPAAILNRDHETGVTIQTIGFETDAGDIIAQTRFPLHGRETAGDLNDLMAQKAGEMLPGVLGDLAKGPVAGKAQNHNEASFCSRLSKDDGRIDWTDSAEAIDAEIRAFTPWPLAWTEEGGQRLYILEGAPYMEGLQSGGPPGTVAGTDPQAGILVRTGNGILGITQLQYQTKKALGWRDFLNGARSFLSARLG